MKRPIAQILIATITFVGLCVAGVMIVGWGLTSHEQRIDGFVQALAREFSVGHPSCDFIKKARDIGAFDYSVTPADAPTKKTPMGEVPDFNPAWNVDEVQFKDEKEYADKLDDLEKRSAELKDGSASIMLMVIPPYGREGCHIDFKDGKVTAVRVFYLD